MKTYIYNSTKALILITSVLLFSFSGCDETTPSPEPEVSEPISIVFNQFFDGVPLVYNDLYKSPQGNDLWITKKEYYVSNVIAIRSDGSEHLIQNIALIKHGTDISAMSVDGTVPKGDYTAIQFDLGVREDLNLMDPATFDISHPLSVTNNMYWTWSTQYIFSKLEGWEINNNDTVSFVIHTGTQDLYRPEINVARNFTVATGGTEVSVSLDVQSILETSTYTFNLVDDGQSHTVDNIPLVIHYMDNFTTAFL
jgi:hypothetical protein